MHRTQAEWAQQREVDIVTTLRSVPDGLTIAEVAEQLEFNYFTTRNDMVRLCNKGKIKATALHRGRATVYRPVAKDSIPTLYMNAQEKTAIEYLKSLEKPTRNAAFIAGIKLPYLIASLFRLAVPAGEIQAANGTQKDRSEIRSELIRFRDSLQETVNNIEILIEHDTAWGDDKVLRKVFGKGMSDAQVNAIFTPHQEFRRRMTDALTGSSED